MENLYRKNNAGQPCFWRVRANERDGNSVIVSYGILGKTVTEEMFHTHRKVADEIKSRINTKRKTGYKYLSEVKDNCDLPVEEYAIIDYLRKYLEEDRTNASGALLPMLAKTYDNTDDKLFSKGQVYIGQPKINGLRCEIGATSEGTDMFKPFRLTFQSREGTIWNSLSDLEDYLIKCIDDELLHKMLNENYVLDGEVYLPGHTVNEINHFVKDTTCKENKLLQYWVYDIAVEQLSQEVRTKTLDTHFVEYKGYIKSEQQHLSNVNRLVLVDWVPILNHDVAKSYRDIYIKDGFEGLILRKPDAEYQFGKRNLSMIKYKDTTDGVFTIIDIYPEGIKRKDIPLFKMRNDINSETFEVSINGSFDYQRSFLLNKQDYIGRELNIEYGERSGVTKVPFHVKTVTLVEK